MSDSNPDPESLDKTKALPATKASPRKIDGELEDGQAERAAATVTSIPGVPDGMLDDVPPAVRSQLMTFISQFSTQGPRPHPLYDKLQPEHIPLLLEAIGKSEKLEFDDSQRTRWFSVIYVMLALIGMGFLIWFLAASNPELLKDLLTHLIAIAGGMGGGYGLSERKRHRQ